MRERRRVKASVCCIARAGYRGAQHVLQPRDPRPPPEDTAKDGSVELRNVRSRKGIGWMADLCTS